MITKTHEIDHGGDFERPPSALLPSSRSSQKLASPSSRLQQISSHLPTVPNLSMSSTKAV